MPLINGIGSQERMGVNMKLGKVILYGALYYAAYKLLTRKKGGSLYGLGAAYRPNAIARALQLGIIQHDREYPGVYFVPGKGWMSEGMISQYAQSALLRHAVSMQKTLTTYGKFYNALTGEQKWNRQFHEVGAGVNN